MKRKKHTTRLIGLTLLLFASGFLVNCGRVKENMNKELQAFILDYENKIITLNKEIQFAEYKASISGKDEDYEHAVELNIKMIDIYSRKSDFAKLKFIKESGQITDTLIKRELDIIFNDFWYYQIDKEKLIELIRTSKEVEKKFSTYRAELGKKRLTDNQIESVLYNSTDNDELEKVWKASKQVGILVADDLIRLVKLRNEAAQSIGFKNFYEMRLILSGQTPSEVDAIYGELDAVTRAPYAQVKYEIDTYLSEQYYVPVDQLRPWHYQNRFFQAPPNIYTVDFDSYYKGKDLVKLVGNYFKGIGLDIQDVIDNSDLYDKPGKSQLGQTFDIDREGDIRILGNVTDNFASMHTFLYETGFAAYLKGIDRHLSYTLRQSAHFFTNDAIAIFFTRFASNPEWLKAVVGISETEMKKIKEPARKALRLEKFVFSRWAQVVYRFEKDLYENPDQDLNKLWWDLVEKYQLLHRPDNRNSPDWAAKTHLVTMPCMYHNYMLGELTASQLFAYINKNIVKKQGESMENCANNPAIGKYLNERFFKPGKYYYWNDLIRYATGEPLSPVYFQQQFVK